MYGGRHKEPGLWLVGDTGVYLMSNGDPMLPDPKQPKRSLVAYAHECNPETMAFDDWWDAKRASFGGDDGVEFVPLASVPEDGNIVIEIGPDALVIRSV
ncbi:MAG: DUF3085 domain-containing protein [Hyphomicrobium sp.]|nr:DUF3085 domain-containing protein [Hyphomicrobium sp.]